jgi:hypothetical protein
MKKTRIALIQMPAVLMFLGLAIQLPLSNAQDLRTDMLKKAFAELLAQTDKNKDGKISIEECCSVWKDKAAGKKKCQFWDENGDGTITQGEYIKQGSKIMK